MKSFIKVDTTTILKHEGYDKVTGKLEDGPSTLLELLKSKAKQFPSDKIFGAINKFLEIEYITCKVVNQCSMKLSKYLSTITKPKEIIGIASANRPEWIIAEHATYYSNCINSPLYTTFKEEALSFILSTTQMRVLIAAPCFAKMVVEKVFDYISSDLLQLEYIILMESNKSVTDLCLEKGIKVISIPEILFDDTTDNFYFDPNFTICAKAERYFHSYLKGGLEPYDQSVDVLKDRSVDKLKDPLVDVLEAKSVDVLKDPLVDVLENKSVDPLVDKSVDEERGLPGSDDLASICFTSGTTGVPKGVQLTHRNFVCQIESFKLSVKHYEIVDIFSHDLYFSYLPLSHVLERACLYFNLVSRATTCFFRGDKMKIAEDLKIIKPTLMACVPKVLQSFYQKIEDEITKKKFHERLVYRAAVSLKIFLQRFGIKSVGILDNKIFKKVSEGFGGKIREVLCGGAALDPYLSKYFMAVLNINIFQGYGQTEGLGASSLATISMKDTETIGVPFPSTKFKLVDLGSSNKGSSAMALFLKGHAIMKGYFIPSDEILNRLLDSGKFKFKIEHIKENPFDEDGWLITGDVVRYENNKVYIIGRNKDLVKLTNGEYISPENIENRLGETSYIKDVFVSKINGDDKFVALVAAPSESVTKLQIAQYLKKSIESMIDDKIIPRCVEIAKFAVVGQNFVDIDDGILFTPTFKKKRFIFSQRFESVLKKAFSIEDVLRGNLSKIADSSIDYLADDSCK